MSEFGGNSLRDMLARRALAEIPRLLTLQDRTPLSPTFGSFDRAWWHYRVMDFPSGMAQMHVLPLALAWSLDMPGNPYRGQPEVRRWIEAGIRFAARSAHPDGSCDDYYPFERAFGAAAFALLACLDAAAIIGIGDDTEIDDFFRRRARWLSRHAESGQLSNHEALVATCLARMAERHGGEWEEPFRARLERLLGWQHEEGWFAEYGGADPGYQTLTIAELADIDRRRPELGLRGPCERAIRFVHAMLHPDGTLGGEYVGRGTVNFFPHGLEIAGSWCPLATAINDLALQTLARGAGPSISDDRLFGHHLTSWMLAWKEWQPARSAPVSLPEGRTVFAGAKLLVEGRGAQRLYLAWSRGGALRLFERDRLLLADTGPALAMSDGRVAVTHLEADNEVEIGENVIAIQGRMAWSRAARLTPMRSVVLRLAMVTAGRWFPDLVRRLLQHLLVNGRRPAPFRFRRRIEWRGDGWALHDEVHADRGWRGVARAGIGGFQCSIATAMARLWQADQLQPWVELDLDLDLDGADPLTVDRFPGHDP